MPRCRIPYFDSSVMAGRCQTRTIRTKRNSANIAIMSFQRHQQVAGKSVPQLNRFITGNRRQLRAVRAVDRSIDRAIMTGQRQPFLLARRGDVPNLHQAAIIARCQETAVWVKRNPPRQIIGHKREQLFACGGIPHFDHAILAENTQQGAIGVKCNPPNRFGVTG